MYLFATKSGMIYLDKNPPDVVPSGFIPKPSAFLIGPITDHRVQAIYPAFNNSSLEFIRVGTPKVAVVEPPVPLVLAMSPVTKQSIVMSPNPSSSPSDEVAPVAAKLEDSKPEWEMLTNPVVGVCCGGNR